MRPSMRHTAASLALLSLLFVSCSSPKRGGGVSKNGTQAAGPTSDSSTSPLVGSGSPTPGATGTSTVGSGGGGSGNGGSGSGNGGNGGGGGGGGGGSHGPVLGVTSSEIKVVYYWKGDRTRTSPYLKGSGAEANVDEGASFKVLIDYLNKHANGGATFMGFPFNLHGRKLVPQVIEAGSTPEDSSLAAEKIAKEIKPFAAIAAHGGVSTYVCPYLASKGIFNIATYDLSFDLYKKTNGWCTPAYASFDAQVDAVQHYLVQRVVKAKYNGTTARKFGFVYAEYPGLADAVKVVVARFKRAGIDIVSTASMSADLTQAQQQAASIVGKFQAAKVNTVIAPEAGSPMSFTPAAESQGYSPDYVVWPCSGQDVPAAVRLFSAKQWTRAEGLSCYDFDYQPDLAFDNNARGSEWYRQYKATTTADPAAQTPMIYSALLPLVAGITNAGRDLTPDTFRGGIATFKAYRYSMLNGRTTSARSILLNPADDEHALMNDFTILKWSATTTRPGNPLAGAYVFPENGRRYERHDAF